MRATSLFRHSPWDGVLVALSLVYGVSLVVAPSALLMALGLWWTANTVSHNFIHLPFFRSRRANAVFAAYLTLLIGFPQGLWRARHLAHHAGHDVARTRWTTAIMVEAALLASVWVTLASIAPRWFLLTYLPGYAAGMALCAMQGYFEHARGTTSHYGRVYNVAFFNDGFHAEHHARPSEHWTRVPRRLVSNARASAWPPVLRWIDAVPATLDALERLVLRSPALQRCVLRSHEAAFRACIAQLPNPQSMGRITIIGGGLFPRTALIVRRVCPRARLTIVDSNANHLEIARAFLGADVVTIASRYEPAHAEGADLVVVPLAYVGDRRVFYEQPPAPAVLVHDWAWRRAGDGARVSWWLLKRMNLVQAHVAARQSA